MTEAPMTVAEWQALTKPERVSAWQHWSNAERSAMFEQFAATTPGFALPYPENYNDPADSPTAFRELAIATDNALGLMVKTATAENRYVQGPTSQVVTDWNSAVRSGFYRSNPGAQNCPATNLGNASWYGIVVQGNTSGHIEQLAWCQTATAYPNNVAFVRTNIGGTWGSWQRQNNYMSSWENYDNFVFMQHGANRVTRFAAGMHKEAATNNSHALDEWRVQCYDLSGNFTWSAIKIPESGIVDMPKGHAATADALRAGDPVSASTAATIGNVVEIVRAMLAGVDPVIADPGSAD